MKRSTVGDLALGVLGIGALLAACGGKATESGPGPTTTSHTGSGGSGAQAGSGGSGAQGATGGSGGCQGCADHEQCWQSELCVAELVTVPGGYAIDATEVTRGQYEAWLALSPPTSNQEAACTWNTSFAPDATCMQSPSVCQGNGCRQHPQPCIDQCDALAYCSAVGKRLCGKIGGGPITGNPFDPAQGEWEHVCTSGGVEDFTYGNAPAPGTCNDYTMTLSTTVPVASLPGCQSPLPDYSGVFDLIGNLAEWEDNGSTATGPTDVCQPRGLSFGMGAAMPACDSSDYAERSEARDNLGFRCCVP
jgi:formylglycine-generating enzyme